MTDVLHWMGVEASAETLMHQAHKTANVYLATRPLLMQHDRAALIVAHDVERVLTDINADYGDCGIEFLRHGVLLVFGAPGQLKTLAGQEPGRTIPLADIAAAPAKDHVAAQAVYESTTVRFSAGDFVR